MTKLRDLVVALTLAQVGWAGAADAGTVILSPQDNIQIAVDGSAAGTIFVLEPAIYRRQSMTSLKDGDSFIGQEAAESNPAILNGSMLLTNWRKVSIGGVEYWTTAGGLPLAGSCAATNCCINAWQDCVAPRNLYFDYADYSRANSFANMASGRWYYDVSGGDGGIQNNIYLVDDPTDHTVELTARRPPLPLGSGGDP